MHNRISLKLEVVVPLLEISKVEVVLLNKTNKKISRENTLNILSIKIHQVSIKLMKRTSHDNQIILL